jgi:Nitroreductase
MQLKHKLYLLKERIKNLYLIPICRRSPFLSSVYYVFFSREFDREHQKVLEGKYMHLKALKSGAPNTFHLRRQVHRLEKGLIMKEKRDVFALDYIMDTVQNFRIISQGMTNGTMRPDPDLLLWTSHVLNKYFQVAGTHPTVESAKKIFEQVAVNGERVEAAANRIPYVRSDVSQSGVTYEQLLALAFQRRSVRWYQDRPVPRELIEKAVAVATLSPSACNRQPFEFRIYDEETIKNKVGQIPMGIRPFYRQIPIFVVLVGKLSAYVSERDRHVIYIDGGLAAMSFMLALETLGLSSVPINWPDIEELEQAMEAAIDLEPDERPMMLIGVGYADQAGMIPFSQKKSPQVIARYN